jgi:hypothetical protein
VEYAPTITTACDDKQLFYRTTPAREKSLKVQRGVTGISGGVFRTVACPWMRHLIPSRRPSEGLASPAVFPALSMTRPAYMSALHSKATRQRALREVGLAKTDSCTATKGITRKSRQHGRTVATEL